MNNNNYYNNQQPSYDDNDNQYYDDNYSNYNTNNGYNEPQQYNQNYQQYNVNNPAYNNQYNNNYNNQIQYNGNEPRPIAGMNNYANSNPIIGKIATVVGWTTILPIIIIVIVVITVFIFAFTSIANITSSVEKLPVASYSDKISVKATLTAVYTKNDEPYYTHEYKGSSQSTESTVNNSSYSYDDNNVNIMPAYISHSSNHDDYSKGIKITGTATNNDNEKHTVTIMFKALKPDEQYDGYCFQSLELNAGETKEIETTSCKLTNMPILDVNHPVIKDGGNPKWSMSSTSGDDYQDNWDKQ